MVMAKEFRIHYFDDLDGARVDLVDCHTVEWSWLGVSYRLDTSTVNLARIEAGAVSVVTLLNASTRIGGRRRATATPPPPGPVGPAPSGQAPDVRSWARAHGYVVGRRGRIAADIAAAYNSQAH